MKTIHCFPTVLGTAVYEDLERQRPAMLAALRQADQEDGSQLRSLLGNPRQTHDRLHQLDAFAPLVDFVQSKLHEYLACFNIADDLTIKLQCCWATFSEQGEGLDMHDHPNADISAVFYVEAAEHAGPVLFRDPRPAARMTDFNVHSRTQLNRHSWPVQPHPGLLVIFPSWLEHRVEPNRALTTRISISMNATLHGVRGSAARLTRAAR